MKRLLRLALLLFLAATIPPLAAGQRPVHLAGFRGVYRGTVEVKLSGRTYFGNARIVVQSGKKGRSATMAISGKFDAGGRSFAISNHIALLRNRSFTETSISNGFPGASVSVEGRYMAHRHRLICRAPFAVNNVSGTALVTAAIRPGRHGKQILTLNTSVDFHGQPSGYFFDFHVSKYVMP